MAEKSGHSNRLTFWIAAAIVLAIVFALLLPFVVPGEAGNELHQQRADYVLVPLRLGGEIFLRVLKMLVVPLVVTSVMAGVMGLGDVRKLGRPGLVTILYYLSTTFLAVLVGLVLVNLIQPGHWGTNSDVVASVEASGGETGLPAAGGIGGILENLALMLFTDNLVKSAANMELLPLIVFSIFFAGLLTTMSQATSLVITLTRQLNDALMAFVLVVMKVAPIGIFCLVAARFGQANVSGNLGRELANTGSYMATVLIGLAVHGGVVLAAILYFFTRRNPYVYMVQLFQPLLMAFSTASSSATLPVTIEATITQAKVNRRAVDFVLPLGATINMDGTALYEAVAAIFIAQVVGIDLTLGQQLIVAMTATLAAIGAAGIPEAGLVTMVIVLTAVGLPTSYMAIILSVDWLLDRFRTTVNVFGDAVGAAVVEKAFPQDSVPTEPVTSQNVPPDGTSGSARAQAPNVVSTEPAKAPAPMTTPKSVEQDPSQALPVTESATPQDAPSSRSPSANETAE